MDLGCPFRRRAGEEGGALPSTIGLIDQSNG